MKNHIINSYTYDSFFNHYFSDNKDWLHKPEQPLLDYVKSYLPDYITTVINFGCASGRDFIPFQDEYNCIGFDLASPSIINWVCKTDNVLYYQCSIEDYLNLFDHSETDLSECLVYTQGSLMYLSKENQNKFIQHLLDHKCKNIVFHEYPPDYVGPHTFFNPDSDYLNLFERKHFRERIEGEPTGFLYLNK
jgi:hypothetical protein